VYVLSSSISFFLISIDMGFCLIFSHRAWFEITSGHLLLIIIWRHLSGDPGSSVSIVSGYGLDDRVIEVRSLVEAKGFFP
jgi:hypothetical protein